MLVEHDPYFIYLLKLYAEQSGFNVISTSSGQQALALAKQEQPSVILLEADLPEMDGGAVLRSLRSDPLTRAIPVVFCTWRDTERNYEHCEVESLLSKPMQYEDFLAALRDIGVLPQGYARKRRFAQASYQGDEPAPVDSSRGTKERVMTDNLMTDNQRSEDDILLEVKDLKKHFPITKGFFSSRIVGNVKAVDGVSFFIRKGETLGLVGESGCGKTTTGRTILRAYEPTGGEIWFQDRDMGRVNVPELERDEVKRLHRNMQMIFQDPYSSLNPRMTLLQIVGEPLFVNKVARGRELQDRVAELLEVVGLRPEYMTRYPHAFSGGQRQRIGVARALALNPQLVVCDEPVSALDVSIQAQTLNLLQDLQEQFGLTYLFIAHDLSVIEHISDRVAVMYVGKLVEHADTRELFINPLHPYTEALLSAVPRPDPRIKTEPIVLPGDVADPANPPSGCYFHPRCEYAIDRCAEEEPQLRELAKDHYVSCHRAEELALKGVLSMAESV
jgi:peptide/nickel transport system ATP-binding protein